jgi:hypothetical protein
MYIFSDKVLPERTVVGLGPFHNLFFKQQDVNIEGNLTFSIQHSIISIQFETEKEISDYSTLRAYISRAVQFQVDILGYELFCGYRIEITQLNYPEHIVFGVSENFSEKSQEIINSNVIGIIDTFLKENKELETNYLMLILADIREATLQTHMTPFYCFRAIESIKNFFGAKYDIKKDDKQWEKLKEELNIERTIIDEVKKFADPIRHGDIGQVISWEKWKGILLTTRQLIDKFIEWNKSQPRNVTS